MYIGLSMLTADVRSGTSIIISLTFQSHHYIKCETVSTASINIGIMGRYSINYGTNYAHGTRDRGKRIHRGGINTATARKRRRGARAVPLAAKRCIPGGSRSHGNPSLRS